MRSEIVRVGDQTPTGLLAVADRGPSPHLGSFGFSEFFFRPCYLHLHEDRLSIYPVAKWREKIKGPPKSYGLFEVTVLSRRNRTAWITLELQLGSDGSDRFNFNSQFEIEAEEIDKAIRNPR